MAGVDRVHRRYTGRAFKGAERGHDEARKGEIEPRKQSHEISANLRRAVTIVSGMMAAPGAWSCA
jgi:hypothetical protein